MHKNHRRNWVNMMKNVLYEIEMLLAVKQLQLALKQGRPAQSKFPAVGTPYQIELKLEHGKEHWILSLTARKDGIFHTTYPYRGSQEEMSDFLATQTAAQWIERMCSLMNEASHFYYP